MAAIPPNLEPAVLAKAGEGLSTRAISAWLLSEHKVVASHEAVAKMLKRTREERSDIAKAVVREKLSGSLLSDLDRLEHYARMAAEIADPATEGQPARDVKTRLAAIDTLRKITDTKLKYSGAGEGGDEKGEGRPVFFLPKEDPRE